MRKFKTILVKSHVTLPLKKVNDKNVLIEFDVYSNDSISSQGFNQIIELIDAESEHNLYAPADIGRTIHGVTVEKGEVYEIVYSIRKD